jgi:hypothetical protein
MSKFYWCKRQHEGICTFGARSFSPDYLLYSALSAMCLSLSSCRNVVNWRLITTLSTNSVLGDTYNVRRATIIDDVYPRWASHRINCHSFSTWSSIEMRRGCTAGGSLIYKWPRTCLPNVWVYRPRTLSPIFIDGKDQAIELDVFRLFECHSGQWYEVLDILV